MRKLCVARIKTRLKRIAAQKNAGRALFDSPISWPASWSSSRATKRDFLGWDRQPAVASSAQSPDGADEPRFNRRPLSKRLTNPRLCKN